MLRLFASGLARLLHSRNVQPEVEKEMGFFEHLDELRSMLVRCVAAFVISMAAAFWWAKEIFAYMRRPLQRALANNPHSGSIPDAPSGANPVELINALASILINGEVPAATAPLLPNALSAADATFAAASATASGNSMVVMKFMDVFSILMNIGLVGGIALSGVFILYFVSQFIAPALTPHEKKCVIPFCISSLALFVGGCAFSFFWLIPVSIQVMFHFVRMFGLTMPWLASDYYGFVTLMTLLVGLTFQFPLIVIILQYLEIVQTRTLFRLWRHVLIGILVASLVISPLGDPISLSVLTSVLFVLYLGAASIGGLLVRSKQKKRATEEAQYEREYRGRRTGKGEASTDTAESSDSDSSYGTSEGDSGYSDYYSGENDSGTEDGYGQYDGDSSGDEDPDQARNADYEDAASEDVTSEGASGEDGDGDTSPDTSGDSPESEAASEAAPESTDSPAQPTAAKEGNAPAPPPAAPSTATKGDLDVIE
ncbi:MAG: twin-arginine translocase subunit TatC [Puniceicoccales bacterium]|jgi:Tat protein translocase TatC|nr:twin-arginine translocase subunit TatC [Puniceicoccales bacterium]